LYLFAFFLYSHSRTKGAQSVSQHERFLLLCFLRTVIIKHRKCLAFWSSRFAFHCIRIRVLIYTLSRPAGNWLYLYHFLCLGLPLTFSKQSCTHKPCGGTLLLWKNKSRICVRIWKLVVRLTVRHSEKVLHSNNFGYNMLGNQMCPSYSQMWIKQERK
jgi:hypothetical protein